MQKEEEVVSGLLNAVQKEGRRLDLRFDLVHRGCRGRRRDMGRVQHGEGWGGQVITKEGPAGKLEPYEEAIIEVPEEHVGQVVDLMGSRKGNMLDMSANAEGGSRITYRIPTRFLLLPALAPNLLSPLSIRPCWSAAPKDWFHRVSTPGRYPCRSVDLLFPSSTVGSSFCTVGSSFCMLGDVVRSGPVAEFRCPAGRCCSLLLGPQVFRLLEHTRREAKQNAKEDAQEI